MLFAFNIGISSGGIQMWEPSGDSLGIEQNIINYTHTDLSTQFKLHYKDIGYLYVGGSIDCASKQEGGVFEISQYNPCSVNFPFIVGIKFKNYIEIGYAYSCMHPMTTYMYDDDLKYKQEGYYKNIFIKITGEIHLWK